MFYLKAKNITQWQNSMMEVNFRNSLHEMQNDLMKHLLIAKFVYNNPKYTSTGFTSFKQKYSYQDCIFFKKNINYFIEKWADL